MRFPEFSGEWETASISECFNLYSGNTPSRIQKENFIGELNWISSGELKSHYLDNTYEHISESIASKNNLKVLPAGTFVIAIYGLEAEGIRGTCSIITKESTISQACMAFLPKGTVTPEFLYGWYKKHGNLIGIKYAQGTKQQNLGYDIVEKLQIKFPSISEQKKLEQFISFIDERIETQKKIIEKYESLIRGLSNKLLDAFKDTSVRLGDILIERSERTKRNNQHEVLSSTVKGIFSQREYFSKDIASENNVGYKVIRRNDVVLSPQNLWMGNINYNDKYDIGIVSPSYKIFSIAEGYDKRFVSALLKTHRALYNYMQVSEQGASVVRRNLNMEAFEQLTFKIPPYTKQCEIGRILDSMQNRLDLAISTQICLEQQKQWLLRNLFI